MNVFDYVFQDSRYLRKNFIAGSSEQASFNEIYKDSLNLAGYLQKILGSGNYIFVISLNSLFFIKAYLAILKSGNICVPVNPEIEKENLEYIRLKCNPDLIFVAKRFEGSIGDFTGIVIDERMMNYITEQYFGNNLVHSENTNPDSIAEVIFTSGSSGRPKGVMLSHKNIVANTSSIIAYLGIDGNDIMQVVLPFYYCYGLSLLHTHLRVGASLVLTNSFIFLGTVINDLRKYRCTGFAGVPSHFQLLLRKTKDFKNTDFPDLRYVTQAGGKLHNAFIEEFMEAFPEIKFYVMYGQTEATARLSYLPPELLKEKLGSIGKGVPGVELKVVDANGKQVMEGEQGEIIAKGDNIMMGYLTDEAATNEVIKDSWLYTGDLARIDKDGYIYITGRKKEIIKIGGNRVSPKEIEDVILQIPFVVDCTVKGMNDEILGESIMAEIVVTSKEGISEDSIKEFCAKRLVSFKIPRVIEIKTELRVSGSGKKISAL